MVKVTPLRFSVTYSGLAYNFVKLAVLKCCSTLKTNTDPTNRLNKLSTRRMDNPEPRIPTKKNRL